jgi:hypothetical protein
MSNNLKIIKKYLILYDQTQQQVELWMFLQETDKFSIVTYFRDAAFYN